MKEVENNCSDFYSVRNNNVLPCHKDDESYKGYDLEEDLPLDIVDMEKALSDNQEEANKIIGCINKLQDLVNDTKTDIDSLNKNNEIKSKLIEFLDNIYPFLSYIYIRKVLLIKYYNISGIDAFFNFDVNYFNFDLLRNELNDIESISDNISLLKYLGFGGSYSTTDEIISNSGGDISNELEDGLDVIEMLYHNYTSNVDIKKNDDNYRIFNILVKLYNYNKYCGVANLSFFCDINSDKFKIEDKDIEDDSNGILYENYYNKLDDPLGNFFTLEERGLTDDISQIDSSYEDYDNNGINVDKVTQATYKVGDDTFYISNKDKFKSFFTENAANIEDALYNKKQEVIGSGLSTIFNVMVIIAKREVGNIIYKSMDIESAISVYDNELTQIFEMLSIISDIVNTINDIKDGMKPDNVKSKIIEHIDCIDDIDSDEAPTDNGNNWKQFPTFNKDTMEIENELDPENPNMEKHCYWLQFSKLATIYGLFPWIDLQPKQPGIGIRYWPIGLKIPTPAGKMINIPLPIIWLPIFTISVPAIGTLVLFIGLSGIFPGIYLFYVNRMGIKKFVLTFRGSSDMIGYDPTGDEPSFRFNKPLALWKENWNFDNKLEEHMMEKFTSKHKFDDFRDGAIDKALSAIDKWGLPDMKNLKSVEVDLNEISVDDYELDNEKYKKDVINKYITSLNLDIKEYIEKINFPKINVVVDLGKRKNENPFEHIINIHKRFSSNKYKSKFGKQIDLKDVFNDLFHTTKFSSEFNNLIMPKQIDIDDDNDFKLVIEFMKKWVEIVVRKMGENEPMFDLLKYPNFKITNPFECKVVYEAPEVNLEILNMILSYVKMIWAGLDGIDKTSFKRIIGSDKFMTEYLFDVCLSVINTFLISFPIPTFNVYPSYGKALTGALKSMLLTIIPEIKFDIPSRVTDLSFDLNDIKSPIISLLDNFDSIEYGFNYNLPDINDVSNFDFYVNFFSGMNSIDVKNVVIDLVKNTLTNILNTFKPIYDGANMAMSIYGLTGNILDSIYLPTSMVKVFLKMLKRKGLEYSIEIPNHHLMNLSFKLMNKLDIIPFPAVSAACSFGMGDIIRKIHPIMPADDLPPWERLTLENFLFNVFLDDFCHNGKMYGGFSENIM